MAERLLVLGAGGHGKVVADLVRVTGREVLGFVGIAPDRVDEAVETGRARVVMLEDALLETLAREGQYPLGADAVALGIGDNRARLGVYSALVDHPMPPLVHRTAAIADSVALGAGTVVLAGAVINAAARVGGAVIINSGAVVEHDCVVEDGAHIAPNATLAGGVRVEECALVGAGAVVLEGRRIGADAVVGAGAVVLDDVPPGRTAVGSPARLLEDR